MVGSWFLTAASIKPEIAATNLLDQGIDTYQGICSAHSQSCTNDGIAQLTVSARVTWPAVRTPHRLGDPFGLGRRTRDLGCGLSEPGFETRLAESRVIAGK